MTQVFNPVEIISKKRDGINLAVDEIEWIVKEYVEGRIPDYQMSALLMAVYFRGMARNEIKALTLAMICSGESVDLTSVPGIKVDKHSTGGVGDKVSLVLAPLVAAAGVPVPMMSGRGLGHTGGTLDKLEAMPGFRTGLTEREFRQILKKTGFAMMGQTESIVPADRKMYALRDVTGTVPSIPLICGSIISKKKAEGADALVLDVKVGKGAFLPTEEETKQLAEELVRLGNDLSLRTVAVLTGMDEPLGYAVGNWLETKESIAALKGEGPPDLMEVVRILGGVMLVLGGKSQTVADGAAIIQAKVETGEGLERFIRMTKLQGGDVSVITNPESFPTQGKAVTIESPRDGIIASVNARETGLLAVALGAGRQRKEDAIDPGAGVLFHKKTGDTVQKGDPLATFYTRRQSQAEYFRSRFAGVFTFSNDPVKKPPIIRELIGGSDSLNLPY